MNKYRKSIRLKNYDYKNNGFYFVTICTNFHSNFISNKEKELIEKELYNLENRFPGLKIEFYQIMQNHLHVIFQLFNSDLDLAKIIQAFKSITTLELKRNGFNGNYFWQRNYYEHIIRNEKALSKIKEYIYNNPLAEKLKIEDIY